ncbi:prolipoprotein diacylglyceryl transferase [Candidatus Methylomirabilis lanthanidiphila]|uniref:Phosphatidylglycerol--prolipoprotein diacylglyceryl transferase n=2 Tax=Candidatus Methylomirabilis lanthanidiphila TaxID=2211376 RepID=A0A564ZIL1_9BACT|nr:prolipoprotein diacylglyceryl transferase [Candidatus Methylomirabilis lanthanidiphila]VUZ84727.1 prolipoprotein diacylglyceryl transferase [Candidatus Methylomirabilis lanthanidiphila]
MFASPGPFVLQIGPLSLRWYGLLFATGVMLGTWLAQREAVRRGEDPEQLLNVIVFGVMAGLIGARLYYVLFNWGYYGASPLKILAVWEGGLAIHGGLLVGGLAAVIYSVRKRLPVLTYLDIMAPSAPLGQAIGRWGNFFNQEAFGTPTDLPWKLYIEPYHRPPELSTYEYFHPTFLYESIWNLLVFMILYFLLRGRLQRIPGALLPCYVGLYSVGRFFVEGLRIDSLMLGPLRAAQVMSLILIVLSAAGLAWLHAAAKRSHRA